MGQTPSRQAPCPVWSGGEAEQKEKGACRVEVNYSHPTYLTRTLNFRPLLRGLFRSSCHMWVFQASTCSTEDQG